MTTYQLRLPKQRRHVWATLLGAAAIALAIGGLAYPAASHAVWDIGKYDSCQFVADELLVRGKITRAEHDAESESCCVGSGGEWSQTQGCTAPPMTAPPPQSPGEANQAPGTGTATQDSPVGQAPQPAPVTQTETAPQPPPDEGQPPRWGINFP